MGSCRPDVNMAQDASSSKVLVLELLERYNLDNRVLMRLLHDVKLVLVGESEDDQVSTTKPSDHDIASFACNSHGIERLVGFDSVVTALHGLVPDLKRLFKD